MRARITGDVVKDPTIKIKTVQRIKAKDSDCCRCAFRGDGCESDCREFWNRNKDLITSRRLRRRQGI